MFSCPLQATVNSNHNYWPHGTSPKYSRRKRNTGFWADDSLIFFENATGNLVHLLNVCHPGRFSLSFPHSARFHGSVCPSNLGEYSLVRLLFFQNLHWVFGYGLQCLGPEELSGNILVSENCDFFYTISFAGF